MGIKTCPGTEGHGKRTRPDASGEGGWSGGCPGKEAVLAASGLGGCSI